jgi:uncharacterized protein YdcH (DUF465 family)
MFQEFLMKKMLKAKGVPEDQVDLIMTLVAKNPELFKKIMEEIQAKIKGGQDQMQASQEVMLKYKDEIQKIMAEVKKR